MLVGRTNKRNYTFVGLAKYEEYCFFVSGGTYVGMGPYSEQYCAFTKEAGKKLLSVILCHSLKLLKIWTSI